MRSSTSRLRPGRPAAVLVAVAAMAVAAACQSSAPDHARATERSAGQRTYVAQYGLSTHAYKPSSLNPSVDGSLYVRGMRWTVWDDHEAIGRGVAHVNDCRPDCADGHYAQHRVTVRLSSPRELCGSRFFTAIGMHGSGYHTYARKPGLQCQ